MSRDSVGEERLKVEYVIINIISLLFTLKYVYKIEEISIDTVSDNRNVIYRSINEGNLFTRLYDKFMSKTPDDIKFPDYRFTKVEVYF